MSIDEISNEHIKTINNGFMATISYIQQKISLSHVALKKLEENQLLITNPKSVEKSVEKGVEKIFELIKNKPTITQVELSIETGLSRRGIEQNISKLKQKGLLQRIGPDKGGYWQILK